MTLRLMYKSIALLVVGGVIFSSFPTSAWAARTINLTTLNGSSSVTVSSGASITAAVRVVTDGSGTNNDWQATSWRIGSGAVNCVNHANHLESGTFTETFSITAPSSGGTYNVQFIAYRNDPCTQGLSSRITHFN